MKDNNQKGNPGLNTIIGPGTIFKGDIQVAGGLRIDGRIEGNVSAKGPLTVGEDAQIIAPKVDVTSAVIGGKIEGDIIAPDMIKLEQTANIVGNIETSLLIIEEGAQFTGKSDMHSDKGKVDKS